MWRSVAIGVVLAGVVAGCSFGGGGQAAGHEATGRLVGTFVTDGGVTLTGSHSDIAAVKDAPMLIVGRSDSGQHIERGTTTDNKGRFAIDLPPGDYTIENGVYTKLRASVHVAAGTTIRKRLVVHVL